MGDLVVGRVLEIGKHLRIEGRDSRRVTLFPGDLIGGAFGNRYATDQFEGYVEPFTNVFHVLGIGGVFGIVRSQNDRMSERPTTVELVGYVTDPARRRRSLLEYGLHRRALNSRKTGNCRTVLVVGASMNSGKTTAAAYTIFGLQRTGARVHAAKLTGTACAKDTAFFLDAGASKVADFSDCGWPSTYLADLSDLLDINTRLRAALLDDAEYFVMEVADGLRQRETEMLLESDAFRDTIDAVIFAGPDALSAESGVRRLKELGYHVVAVSGLVSTSSLGINEVTRVTGLPCLNNAGLSTGQIRQVLDQVSVR
ncbi:MAG TPA: DUF1611 domain-containing protein [Candidatus Polarisedimenticolia bacterium]|nr:DUF1611 domain-containing protein [Candidatus Polarisedimenticolia bacterium]